MIEYQLEQLERSEKVLSSSSTRSSARQQSQEQSRHPQNSSRIRQLFFDHTAITSLSQRITTSPRLSNRIDNASSQQQQVGLGAVIFALVTVLATGAIFLL